MCLLDRQVVRIDYKRIVGASAHSNLVTGRSRSDRFGDLGVQVIPRVIRSGVSDVDCQGGQHGPLLKRLESESGLTSTQS